MNQHESTCQHMGCPSMQGIHRDIAGLGWDTPGVYMEHIGSSFTVICISTVMWFHTQLSYNLSRKIACARDFSWLGQYCDITAGC